MHALPFSTGFPVGCRGSQNSARVVIALLIGAAFVAGGGGTAAGGLDRVRVAADGRSFVLEPSGRPFVPWGFNYDHDEQGRLIEDYWEAEWPKIESDFREMRDLGANTVRVHLQFGKFFLGPGQPNLQALERLERLVALAERLGLYLDVTGLGCYHKQDVPAWYDALGEAERWQAQAAFWEAVAQRLRQSPAVFCYDLMNEPVVPGGRREAGQWLAGAFAGKHFVQFITLDQAGRPRPEIARAWTRTLAAAIRRHDPHHLVTVGLVDWSLDRPGLTSGFVPSVIAPEVDFLCVHLYPEKGKLRQAIHTLEGFAVGKPVVVEETFPLRTTVDELEQFLEQSEGKAAGWLGFYWGKTPEECRRANTIADAITLQWLELFQRRSKRWAQRPQ